MKESESQTSDAQEEDLSRKIFPYLNWRQELAVSSIVGNFAVSAVYIEGLRRVVIGDVSPEQAAVVAPLVFVAGTGIGEAVINFVKGLELTFGSKSSEENNSQN